MEAAAQDLCVLHDGSFRRFHGGSVDRSSFRDHGAHAAACFPSADKAAGARSSYILGLGHADLSAELRMAWRRNAIADAAFEIQGSSGKDGERLYPEAGFPLEWPLPNVWLGTSVEDQAAADERIPVLLDTPAASAGSAWSRSSAPWISAPWHLHDARFRGAEILNALNGQLEGMFGAADFAPRACRPRLDRRRRRERIRMLGRCIQIGRARSAIMRRGRCSVPFQAMGRMDGRHWLDGEAGSRQTQQFQHGITTSQRLTHCDDFGAGAIGFWMAHGYPASARKRPAAMQSGCFARSLIAMELVKAAEQRRISGMSALMWASCLPAKALENSIWPSARTARARARASTPHATRGMRSSAISVRECGFVWPIAYLPMEIPTIAPLMISMPEMPDVRDRSKLEPFAA
jgi:hypothetical protein